MESKDEAIEALGFDPAKIKTKEDLITAVNDTYVKRTEALKDEILVSSITGKVMGSIESKLKQSAKEWDFDLNSEDLKDKKVLDKLDGFIKHTKSKYETDIESWKSQVKGDDGKALKEWEKKYEKVNRELDETKGLIEPLRNELETTKAEFSNKIKSFKLTGVHEKPFKEIKWNEKAADKLVMKGFNSDLKEKYDLDIDDSDVHFVIDKTTKKKIQSEKKAGTFATWEEIVEKEAIASGLVSLKPDQNGKGQSQNFSALDNFQGQNNNNNNNTEVANSRGMGRRIAASKRT